MCLCSFLYYLMSLNKSISYILCNKDIIVNLYKLHFLSSHFSPQPNKSIFHLPTFPPLQPNTHERKPNIFYPSTNFLSFHFFTPPTKRTLKLCGLGLRSSQPVFYIVHIISTYTYIIHNHIPTSILFVLNMWANSI